MRLRKRISWALVFAACAAALVVARHLEPAPRGLGTHTQLARGPCPFKLFAGIPCATCGMTTSFAYGVRLRVGEAFAAQPFGALLCLAAVVMAPVALLLAVTGRGPRVHIPSDRALAPVLLFLIAGWVYKILSCAAVL